jgi:hypothetical protein
MDISSSTASTAAAVQIAVQQQTLAQLKAQGAGMLQLLASASPAGSVNGPSQGHFIDAFA